jgi:hypothetical protein
VEEAVELLVGQGVDVLTNWRAIAMLLVSPRSDSSRLQPTSRLRSRWLARCRAAARRSSSSMWGSRSGFQAAQLLQRGQRRQQVVVHRAFGALRIALYEGVDQDAMLVDRRVDASGQVELSSTQHAQELTQVRGGAVEPAVGGQCLHAHMEDMVGAVVAIDILRRGMVLQSSCRR